MSVHVQRAELPWVTRTIGVPERELTAHDPGDVVRVGELAIELLHTPGHTPGSQCLFVDGKLLTGDTLFLEGCGRTDLPGANAEEMYTSLQRLAALPDGTVIYRSPLLGAVERNDRSRACAELRFQARLEGAVDGDVRPLSRRHQVSTFGRLLPRGGGGGAASSRAMMVRRVSAGSITSSISK